MSVFWSFSDQYRDEEPGELKGSSAPVKPTCTNKAFEELGATRFYFEDVLFCK